MPALRTQVVFDAADPHTLAAFWAEALHYEHEELSAFIDGLLEAGHAPVELTTEVDGKRRWREPRPCGTPTTRSNSASAVPASAVASSSRRCRSPRP